MKRHFAFAFAALALAGTTVFAAPATYKIDSSHSSATFKVRHMMISNVSGEFSTVTGTLKGDLSSPQTASVEASVDVSTVNTREPKRDGHLKSPDFFDVAKNPTMTFKSKKIAVASPGKLKMLGDLTMRGVTKEVMFDVDGPTPETKDPWGNTRVGASATATINRQDFGLTWNKTLDTGGVLVGDQVSITIDVEFVKEVPPPADSPKK